MSQLDFLDDVLTHADEGWKDCAWRAIETLAASGREFQIFDVTELGVPEPADPKSQWGALGAAVGRKARAGELVEFVRYEKGRRPTVNGSACAVWRGIQRGES